MSLLPSSELIKRLQQQNLRRVALQFPAGLKRQAHSMALALKKAGFEPIVSGDPCYGACDIPEGLHHYADVIVHFGHAPFAENKQVIFELVPKDFDINVLGEAVPILMQRKVGLVTTVQHAHLVDAMIAFLSHFGIDAIVVKGSSPRTPLKGQILGCNFEAAKRTGATEILYVGTGLFHPMGVQLATGARVIALDPFAKTAQLVDGTVLMKRRTALIERAKKAKSIGIIVSLKSGQRRFELAQRLAALSENAVLVAMNDVAPDELLNLGFGCYVNTACPRLAYDDQARFSVPVLSPQEFEIVCGIRPWREYKIDEIC